MKIRIIEVTRGLSWPLWAVLLVVGWSGLGAATILVARRFNIDVPFCVFKRFTGIACPTCGVTRGTFSCLKGNFIEGWLYNPFVFTAFLIFGAVIIARVIFARGIELKLGSKQRKLLWGVILLLFVLNWAYVVRYVG